MNYKCKIKKSIATILFIIILSTFISCGINEYAHFTSFPENESIRSSSFMSAHTSSDDNNSKRDLTSIIESQIESEHSSKTESRQTSSVESISETSKVNSYIETSKEESQIVESKIDNTIYIINITSPINNGQIARIEIKGVPNTEYNISVYYDTTVSKAAGLGKKHQMQMVQ